MRPETNIAECGRAHTGGETIRPADVGERESDLKRDDASRRIIAAST